MDNTSIYTKMTFEQHLENLKETFRNLHSRNIKLKLKKCHFRFWETELLGHIISHKCIKTQQKKVEQMLNLRATQNKDKVQSVLGNFGYYRWYIKDFAKIALPLKQLLCKNQTWKWTSECQEAFETLRTCISDSPI